MIKDFEQQGIIPETVIPDSDEKIAKAALCEACVLALAPGDKRTRLMAINTVLKFTKPLPMQRHATTLTTSEEWLMRALSELQTNESPTLRRYLRRPLVSFGRMALAAAYAIAS